LEKCPTRIRKEPKVKIAELLKALEDARAGLEAVLAGLDETQLLAADTCGTWSIKDVLAHLTACEAELVTGLSRIRRGQNPGKILYTDAEIQAQNEKWQAENRDRPLDRVLADFRGVRRQLVRQLESLGDQDLNAPRPWFQKRTIADWVQDEIVAHDRDHAVDLAEWRKRQGL
jgi:uncharacterized protein (TIGR03083 family)